MSENALVLLAQDPSAILSDGITGNEPIFDVALMRNLAQEKLLELKSLPQGDLTTEDGRKSLKKAIKPIKQLFDDFEKNIKIVKKAFCEIPKKCDAVSKALRDLAEPEIAKIEQPFAELKEQEKLTEKWWKLEGIPHTKWELESGLQALMDTKPSRHSTEAEIADFYARKGGYIKAWEEAINRIYLAEKADKEEKERQASEARRLAEEAERIRREKEAMAEEQARIDKANAELEEKKKAYEAAQAASQQAEANPGAPPADSEEERKKKRRLALRAIESVAAEHEIVFARKIAECIARAIHAGQIPFVRFVYE